MTHLTRFCGCSDRGQACTTRTPKTRPSTCGVARKNRLRCVEGQACSGERPRTGETVRRSVAIVPGPVERARGPERRGAAAVSEPDGALVLGGHGTDLVVRGADVDLVPLLRCHAPIRRRATADRKTDPGPLLPASHVGSHYLWTPVSQNLSTPGPPFAAQC